MKFVLVNHSSVRRPACCAACSRPLERGFLHDLSTHRRYCGVECYRIRIANSEVIGWLTEINPLALAIGWLHFTVTFLSALFDAERRDSAV